MGYSAAIGEEYNLPYDVPANQYLTIRGSKASTSRRMAVWVPDFLSRYDPDPLRYYLAATMPESSDSDFTWTDFVRRNNDELVATWGNLVNRVLSFAYRNFNASVPKPGPLSEDDRALVARSNQAIVETGQNIALCHFRAGLESAMSVAREANRYIEENAPWKLISEDRERCATVLHTAIGAISGLNVALSPYLPFSCETLHGSLGVHPHDAKTLSPPDTDALARLAENPRVVAIGEIGLDFYRNLSPPSAQREAFREQLQLARSLRLPVVIHARDADEEAFDILAAHSQDVLPEWPKDRPLGVMHCFAGDTPLALRYIELGFLISIAGTVTYPNAEKTRAVARSIPFRSMVVETDAPYLTPQSRRGRRNEPPYIIETIRQIAELRAETASAVAQGTASAAARLFALGNITDFVVEAAVERP